MENIVFPLMNEVIITYISHSSLPDIIRWPNEYFLIFPQNFVGQGQKPSFLVIRVESSKITCYSIHSSRADQCKLGFLSICIRTHTFNFATQIMDHFKHLKRFIVERERLSEKGPLCLHNSE